MLLARARQIGFIKAEQRRKHEEDRCFSASFLRIHSREQKTKAGEHDILQNRLNFSFTHDDIALRNRFSSVSRNVLLTCKRSTYRTSLVSDHFSGG